MKFTILPDMEAKRENAKQRKKARRRRKFLRQEKRRRKYLSKHETFITLFLKRWLVFLVIGALVCATGTKVVERSAHEAARKEYELWVKGIANSANTAIAYIETQKGDLGDEEKLAIFRNIMKAAMLNGNYSDLYDFSATMYDITPRENGEKPHAPDVVCDSRKEFIMVLDEYNGMNYTDKITTYHSCPAEIFGDLADKITQKDAEGFHIQRIIERLPDRYIDFVYSKSSHWIWGMDDYYIKGSEFRPGVVWEARTNKDNFRILDTIKTYDLTPDNVSGWTHIVKGEEKEKRYSAEYEYPQHFYTLYTGGTKEGSRADQQTGYCRVVKHRNGTTGIESGIGYIEDDNRTKLVIDMVRIPTIRWESLGKEYTVITEGYYDFYARHMKTCIKVYWVIGFVMTALALFISWLRWLRVKVQLDTERYRQSITDAMAHDLKSPLMAISGYAENLKDNVHTDKRDYYADAIAQNVLYMNDIIEHILELSKTETREIKLNKEALELETLVDEIIRKYTMTIDAKGLNVDVQGDIKINADRQLITQAIDNLISNAVKFAIDKTTISIECEKNHLIIKNNCKALENKDMDASDLLKPFVKGDSSRSNKSGSGIGLTIAKNIFDLHGYTMKLTSTENEFIVKVSF
ncbi:MAG: HAMP domain-containing histidine kinase [Lachnospiraceae bacterium]|nr:HAMP domain-containing histidine kinase [Lachnospiraceae bacterium]